MSHEAIVAVFVAVRFAHHDLYALAIPRRRRQDIPRLTSKIGDA
jgi:hypothetical protein